MGLTMPERVAARWLYAKRPIPIWHKGIETFVSRKLVPQVVRWLKRQPQDEPIGASSGIAKGELAVEAVDGKEILVADVWVSSKPAKGKWAAVLGGSAGKRRFERGEPHVNIHLFMNGALSPEEYLTTESGKQRLQSLSSCTYETCLPYGLYSILTHEVTHTAEVMFRQDPTYFREDGIDEEAYVNDPGEVRAFMQQVVEEAVRIAKKLHAIPGFTEKKTNRELVDIFLKMTTTWKGIEKNLNRSNKAQILKAVHYGLDQAGLLH